MAVTTKIAEKANRMSLHPYHAWSHYTRFTDMRYIKSYFVETTVNSGFCY